MDAPLVTRYDPLDVPLTGERIHELALQRWCNDQFHVRQGYPTPVIFAMPRDAYGAFLDLWRTATNPENPFHYLLALKDAEGRPIYEPYPSNVRYPLISISRQDSSPRPEQSYGVHRYRRLFWPTVSDDVLRQDLGQVAQAQMPHAWNFRYQIDHYSMRPQTHAAFRTQMRKAFRAFASIPQTFIVARYPGYYGPQLLRMTLEGGVQDTSGMEFDDKAVEYRSTVTLVIEGYEVSFDMDYLPTLWHLCAGENPLPPEAISQFFAFNAVQRCWDLREEGGENPVLNDRLPTTPPVE